MVSVDVLSEDADVYTGEWTFEAKKKNTHLPSAHRLSYLM